MSEKAVAWAEKRTKEVTSKCKLFDASREKNFPRIQDTEIQLGKVLGRGGFCVVNEISDFTPSATFLEEEVAKFDLDLKSQIAHREDVMSRCIRNGEARYALKKLSSKTLEDEELAGKGIVDLALEAKFLAVLSHRNIIKLRAVSTGYSYTTSYFVVLDRLYDTLEKRLKTWKSQEKKLGGFMSKVKGKDKKNEFIVDKLTCMYDLASALGFMHENNVIYRDLKPENIGFDVRDDPKIFDLGLAKELDEDSKTPDGNYKLTGWTGSPCYMAPEVALMKPYNLSADVYSYGILLWEVNSYEMPYKTFTMKMLEEYVLEKGYRPKVNPKWMSVWKDLMLECWDQNPEKRPNFDSVLSILREKIYQLEGDGDMLDVDASHHSRHGGR